MFDFVDIGDRHVFVPKTFKNTQTAIHRRKTEHNRDHDRPGKISHALAARVGQK
jgi:hypothetical protein